jgi:hypothetical protein
MATNAWGSWRRQSSSNGEPVDLVDDEAFALVVDVAKGKLGVGGIVDRFISSPEPRE